MSWTIAYHEAAADELAGQPADIRAKLDYIVELIGAFGLGRLSPKYTLKGKDGIARALYVTAKGKRIVVVRVFTKKTQKTPRNEIKVALKRAMEVT